MTSACIRSISNRYPPAMESKFLWVGILPDLCQPVLELLDATTRDVQFLIVVDHVTTSTMPRFDPSRLTCQCETNASSD